MLNYDYSYTKEELVKWKSEDRKRHILFLIVIGICESSAFFALFLNSLIAWIILFIIFGGGFINMVKDLCKIIIGYFLHLPYLDCAHIRFYSSQKDLEYPKDPFHTKIFIHKLNGEIEQIDNEIVKKTITMEIAAFFLKLSGNWGRYSGNTELYREIYELQQKQIHLQKLKRFLEKFPPTITKFLNLNAYLSGAVYVENFYDFNNKSNNTGFSCKNAGFYMTLDNGARIFLEGEK